MKKIFYEKVGRKYVPVSEYDNELLDSFPKGSHLVICYPGGASRRFNIDPNYAALIAAGRVAEDSMREAIRTAAEMHPDRTAILSPEQKAAWEHFVEVMGERGRYVHYKSIHDIAEAGINALQEEAFKLMKHETVKSAFEQFLMVSELCAAEDKEKC